MEWQPFERPAAGNSKNQDISAEPVGWFTITHWCSILFTNMSPPTLEELLMKSCISYSNACHPERCCWTLLDVVVRAKVGNRTRAALPSLTTIDVYPSLPCTREPRVRQQRHKHLLKGLRAHWRGAWYRGWLKGHESRSKNGPKQRQCSSQLQHLNSRQAWNWHCGYVWGCSILSFLCQWGKTAELFLLLLLGIFRLI